MAELVMGIGMSHSPMVLTDDVGDWMLFASEDRSSPLLVDTAGRKISFAQLEEVNGDRYAAQADPAHLASQATAAREAVGRLKRDLLDAAIDVVVVVGDDQMELFEFANLPSLAVYYGDELVTATDARVEEWGGERVTPTDDQRRVDAGYGMDAVHRFPGHPALGLHVIASLQSDDFDVGALRGVTASGGGGVGHAFGVVPVQLMDDEKIPVLPIYVNTYWPPNQLSLNRCYKLGEALRRSIESYPEDIRVAIVASGGLSHFVVDEDLDHQILTALRRGDPKALCELPPELCDSGNSEIRNWIVVASACQGLGLAWERYLPVYRTPQGTGCGLAFVRWA